MAAVTICSDLGAQENNVSHSLHYLPIYLPLTAVATELGKVSFHSNPKECSNYCTTALTLHTSKVILKILQAKPQQYVNCEFPDVQAGFRKGRGTRDPIANIC